MHPVQRCKILIIEDNPVDREVYKRCLRQFNAEGFEFAEADCAAAGIEKAKSWKPDCALLDVNLPDMDGIEILTRLKDSSEIVPCATIVLTAFGGESVAVRAMKAGAMDYLPKGQVSAGTLAPIVRNAIERFLLQRRLEEQRSALERSEQRYQLLLEAMPQMVWSANSQGRIEYANRHWLDYTGTKLDASPNLVWDRLVHPEDRSQTWDTWHQAVQTGSVFEVEHRMRRASDGSHRWHLVRAIPLPVSRGGTTTWLGTCTEIESQKQAARVILENQKLESIGRLAGGLAHDFNNLLVTILCGACYAMKDLPPHHPAYDMLQEVVQAGERAAEITRKMLAYAGKSTLGVERADLSQVVQEAIAQTAIPKNIHIRFQDGGSLPAVQTDSRQLRQVILDLIRNAVEAIDEGAAGTISVRTDSIQLREPGAHGESPAALTPGEYVVLEVGDTGCGMDPETRGRIFDPFFTTKFAGRGLSLAAVQGFARSNGGEVHVDSTPGKGTRFRVLLPAAPGHSECARN